MREMQYQTNYSWYGMPRWQLITRHFGQYPHISHFNKLQELPMLNQIMLNRNSVNSCFLNHTTTKAERDFCMLKTTLPEAISMNSRVILSHSDNKLHGQPDITWLGSYLHLNRVQSKQCNDLSTLCSHKHWLSQTLVFLGSYRPARNRRKSVGVCLLNFGTDSVN